MIELLVQPGVYSTGANRDTVQSFLAEMWAKAPQPSHAYVVSGFVNVNGVLPFVKDLAAVVAGGGSVNCYFGGSASQRMTSKQAVVELVGLGATVNVLSRKKIMHAKMYGIASASKTAAVITSGNFTGNGISLNIEASAYIDGEDLEGTGFSWPKACTALEEEATWNKLVHADLENPTNPGWKLLFDEESGAPEGIDTWAEGDEILAMTLSPTDVARITGAQPLGTQYFWLSRFVSGFFPPLTELPEKPDAKRTFKTSIQVEFVDVGETADCTVTFEAYNNLDFRLLTSPLKGTGLADAGDMMILRRRKEREYVLKVLGDGTPEHATLLPYLIHPIGIKDKRYGWVPLKVAKDMF